MAQLIQQVIQKNYYACCPNQAVNQSTTIQSTQEFYRILKYYKKPKMDYSTTWQELQ